VIIAAADGSSLSNPGPAGWAWYVDDEHWASGGWPLASNNRAELTAVLDLLRQTEPDADQELHVVCDSQYVINALTKWLPGWKRRGWRRADGKPVLNADLLRELDQALSGRRVSFEWVRGHVGHPMNEAADARARATALAYQQGRKPNRGPGWRPGAPVLQPQPAGVEQGRALGEPDLFSTATEPVNTAAESVSTAAEPSRSPSGWDGDCRTVLKLERDLLADGTQDVERLTRLLHPELVACDSHGELHSRPWLLDLLRPPMAGVTVDESACVVLGPSARLVYSRITAQGVAYQSGAIWVSGASPTSWQLRYIQVTRRAA
jgi:ribonuclease HI